MRIRLTADELNTYAKSNLPATSGKEVEKAADEVEFRAEFKRRLAPQLAPWIQRRDVAPSSR